MSDQPKPLSDSELSQVVGGAASALGAGLPGGISSLRPEDIHDMLALMQNTANEMRNSAREARSGEIASQASDIKSAAESIADAARTSMNGAITAGVVQFGVGSTAGDNQGLSNNHGSSGIGDGRAGDQIPNLQQVAGHFDKIVAGAPPPLGDIAGAPKADQGTQVSDQMQLMMDVLKDVREKQAELQKMSADALRTTTRNP